MVATVSLLVGGACSGSPGDDLDDRVHDALVAEPGPIIDRLAELGLDADAAALEEAEVRCPTVDDPQPGDTATCTVVGFGDEVTVDVQFADGGGVQVVGVDAVP